MNNQINHLERETYWGNVNPIGIRSCYDEGKRAAETLLMDMTRNKANPLNVGISRLFNTYGPFMDPKDGRVISNLIIQGVWAVSFFVLFFFLLLIIITTRVQLSKDNP